MEKMLVLVLHDDAFGYDYTASYQGVLVAKGWIRANSEALAIESARRVGYASVRAEWGGEPETGQLGSDALLAFFGR
jgi:hypothetical protein